MILDDTQLSAGKPRMADLDFKWFAKRLFVTSTSSTEG